MPTPVVRRGTSTLPAPPARPPLGAATAGASKQVEGMAATLEQPPRRVARTATVVVVFIVMTALGQAGLHRRAGLGTEPRPMPIHHPRHPVLEVVHPGVLVRVGRGRGGVAALHRAGRTIPWRTPIFNGVEVDDELYVCPRGGGATVLVGWSSPPIAGAWPAPGGNTVIRLERCRKSGFHIHTQQKKSVDSWRKVAFSILSKRQSSARSLLATAGFQTWTGRFSTATRTRYHQVASIAWSNSVQGSTSNSTPRTRSVPARSAMSRCSGQSKRARKSSGR